MRTAPLEEMTDRLAEVFSWVEQGEVVEITIGGEAFATLSPQITQASPETNVIPPWPDLMERLNVMYPDGPVGGTPMDEIVSYGRGNTECRHMLILGCWLSCIHCAHSYEV